MQFYFVYISFCARVPSRTDVWRVNRLICFSHVNVSRSFRVRAELRTGRCRACSLKWIGENWLLIEPAKAIFHWHSLLFNGKHSHSIVSPLRLTDFHRLKSSEILHCERSAERKCTLRKCRIRLSSRSRRRDLYAFCACSNAACVFVNSFPLDFTDCSGIFITELVQHLSLKNLLILFYMDLGDPRSRNARDISERREKDPRVLRN